MATKSIIEIEVDDSQFKAYQSSFDAYKQDVSQLPQGWDNVSKKINEATGKAKAFNDLAKNQKAVEINETQAAQPIKKEKKEPAKPKEFERTAIKQANQEKTRSKEKQIQIKESKDTTQKEQKNQTQEKPQRIKEVVSQSSKPKEFERTVRKLTLPEKPTQKTSRTQPTQQPTTRQVVKNTASDVAQGFSNTVKRLSSAVSWTTKTIRNTISSFASAIARILKFSAIGALLTGVAGAGGLFGLRNLSDTVMNKQAQTMRINSNYGATQAAQNTYGQLLGGAGGVQSVLEAIQTAKTSYGMYNGKPIFAMAGMEEKDWKDKQATDILPKYLEAVQKVYQKLEKSTGGMGQTTYAQAMGLTDVMDANTLTQLSQTNLDALKKQFDENQKQVDLSKQTQDAWSNLSRILTNAGQSIEAVFVKGLQPLLPSLEKLSDSVVGFAKKVMESGIAEKMIDTISVAIDKFASYLLSNQLESDFARIANGLKQAGDAIAWFGDVIMGIKQNYDKASEFVDETGKTVSKTWDEAVNAGNDVYNSWTSGIEPRGNFEEEFEPLAEKSKNRRNEVWQSTKDTVSEWYDSAKSSINDTIEDIEQSLSSKQGKNDLNTMRDQLLGSGSPNAQQARRQQQQSVNINITNSTGNDLVTQSMGVTR